MIDPRLVFLARASARLILAEAGEIELHEAVDISDRWKWIETLVARWERTHPYQGDRVATTDIPRPTPEATIEAIMHAVRERGLAALKEPATAERLSRCDASAKAEIERRIANLRKG
jgi:hypothetical protein